MTQGFACQGEQVHELELQELHAFLGERYLVTVHQAGSPRSRRSGPGSPATDCWRSGVDFAYYLVLDGIVDDNFPILDRVADELDDIEDAVLASPQREDLHRIFELKRHLVAMRKVLSPQRDVQGLLSKRGDPRVSERTALYLRDVYDHLVRINESIEANRDLLGNALDAYLSAVGQRTNEIMKYLTVMSAVFLPLSFVVGFFGQNFDNLPLFKDWVHSDGLMWSMIACASPAYRDARLVQAPAVAVGLERVIPVGSSPYMDACVSEASTRSSRSSDVESRRSLSSMLHPILERQR